jgi:deoxyhypusine synthase
MISCGQREIVRFLAQHKLIDCIVTTAGGVEEDFIKCLAPFYIGDFRLAGRALRAKGLNRIGNLLVPNSNYRKFEDWLTPILEAMRKEQEPTLVASTVPGGKPVIKPGTSWTPSKLIHRLGLEMKDESSVYHWCARNNIPVFCPAITDGSIGDMIYFRGSEFGLKIDVVEDLALINQLASMADKTGAIILGGGIIKHHICNANLMRNGADFAVYVNTAHEWDGSDAGASPDEAISWGKIKVDAQPVKLVGDASLLFPILVAQTFAPLVAAAKKQKAAAATATAAAPAPM